MIGKWSAITEGWWDDEDDIIKKDYSICNWDGEQWVEEADLWVHDIVRYGIAQDTVSDQTDALRQQEARKKLDDLKEAMSEYANHVYTQEAPSTWFINDAVMYFYMYLPDWLRKKVAITYGNYALSANYFNKICAREYLKTYNKPTGMMFVNFACRGARVWRAPGIAFCFPYGDEMIDNIISINGRYRMSYE